MINSKLVEYIVDLSKLFGFSSTIPFGLMIQDFMNRSKFIDLRYFLVSLVCASFGLILLFLGYIIRRRYNQ